MATTVMLQAGATVAAGAFVKLPRRNEVNGPTINYTFQSIMAGATTSSTIAIEVSNDGVNVLTMGTLTTTPTTVTDGFTSTARWQWARANVTAIGGTNAAATVIMGW